jgi:hypothetical protein
MLLRLGDPRWLATRATGNSGKEKEGNHTEVKSLILEVGNIQEYMYISQGKHNWLCEMK